MGLTLSTPITWLGFIIVTLILAGAIIDLVYWYRVKNGTITPTETNWLIGLTWALVILVGIYWLIILFSAFWGAWAPVPVAVAAPVAAVGVGGPGVVYRGAVPVGIVSTPPAAPITTTTTRSTETITPAGPVAPPSMANVGGSAIPLPPGSQPMNVTQSSESVTVTRPAGGGR